MRRCCALIVCLVLSLRSALAADAYKGAIVIDAMTGEVLFEDQADRIAPPASMTKLMTFLLVHEAIESGQLSLETAIPVTAASSQIGGTRVWLREGERFSVEELLYALMLHSANDVAHALALAILGSIEGFAEAMTERAQSLGLTLTRFRNPHGLPPASAAKRSTIAEGNLSTPRNIAALSRYLVHHTDILTYSGTKTRRFRAHDPKRYVDMRNHNHLLGRIAGVDGLKTGYTRSAGFCLAATAERAGQRVIAVIMGAPTAQIRDLTMIELLEQGFATVTLRANADTGNTTPLRDTEGRIEFRIPN